MSRADIVYIVSRFPLTTETFIVRELDGLDGSGRFDLELRSLFPSPDTVVHDIARRWDERLIRPSAGQAVAGFGEGAGPAEGGLQRQLRKHALHPLAQLPCLRQHAAVAARRHVDGIVRAADQQPAIAGAAQVQVRPRGFPHQRVRQSAQGAFGQGIGDVGVAARVARDACIQPVLRGIAGGQHHLASAQRGAVIGQHAAFAEQLRRPMLEQRGVVDVVGMKPGPGVRAQPS